MVARVLSAFGVTRERVRAWIEQQSGRPRGRVRDGDGTAVRAELAEVCRRLYARGLVTSVAGNVSAREGDRLYITPTGFALDAVAPEDVVVTDLEGRVLEGRHRPSSELPLHRAVYRAEPEVRAVVHTHSPVATAFSVRGEGLAPVTTEAEMLLGEVPLVPYAPPGSEGLGAAVAERVRCCRAVLLERHGVVAWGGSLREAFHRAELAEETARVHFLLRLLAAAPARGWAGGPPPAGGATPGVGA